jgi:hypothetical protein
MLREAHDMIEGLELHGTVFRADHASNYLSLEGRLPRDRGTILSAIRSALDGTHPLRPDAWRGL